jgi:hypothetical protein
MRTEEVIENKGADPKRNPRKTGEKPKETQKRGYFTQQ